MKIFGMLAASVLWASAAPSAPHAKAAAPKSAAASAPAKPAATNAPKPATTAKPPAAVHPTAAKPPQRATDLRATVVYRRPIELRRVYWLNFCLYHPLDAFCQGPEFAALQATPAAPGVIPDSFSATTQPSGPTSMPSNAPAEPIVKVSDELAAGVSVGSGQADILQKLGEPHSRISGDVERYTYFLQSGGSLRLDFQAGRVTQVQKASN
jgi:hypothetical protein